MNDEMIARLVHFIEGYGVGVFSDFKIGIRQRHKKDWYSHLKNTAVTESIINYSLLWGDTPQGRVFWENMSKDWLKNIHSIQREIPTIKRTGCNSIW